jgi:D-sedoheptulose 7-phosphate isomerase
VEQWAECGDLLIAFSSSGESANIVQAALAARARRCSLVTFSGFRASNRLRPLGDVSVYVPVCHYGYVEVAHAFVVHCLTDVIAGSAAAAADQVSPAAPDGVTLRHASSGPR